MSKDFCKKFCVSDFLVIVTNFFWNITTNFEKITINFEKITKKNYKKSFSKAFLVVWEFAVILCFLES